MKGQEIALDNIFSFTNEREDFIFDVKQSKKKQAKIIHHFVEKPT